MNNPYETRHEDNLTESERISRDWENERREERRYQRELHADASDYTEAKPAEAPEPRKPLKGWTTQMNLFDEEVA